MSLNLPSADDLGASLAQAADDLDQIVFPSEREKLHREIESYLAFSDIVHDGQPVDHIEGVVERTASYTGYPHCANCGHATHWPVPFCHHCITPKEES